MEAMTALRRECAMIFKTAAGLCLLFFITSCGLRVGDVYKDLPSKGSALDCMNHLNDRFNNFLTQKIPKEEALSFPKCLQSALLAFKYHVSGENQEIYTPDELRNFIQKFFLTDQKIQDSLMDSLMVLKTHSVGGTKDRLTSQEIDQLIVLIQHFGRFMEGIYPYNRILFTSVKAPPEEVDKGLENLKQKLQQLFKEIFQRPYSLQSAYDLNVELEKLLNNSNETPNNIAFMQMIQPLASFIFNETSKDIVLVEEWEELINSMVSLYSIFTYFRLASIHKDHLPQRVVFYSKTAQSVLYFLEKTIHSQHHSSSIQGAALWNLANRLYSEGIITHDLRLSSLASLFQALFGKIIAGSSKGFDFSIGAAELENLKAGYNRWAAVQQILNQSQRLSEKSKNSQIFSKFFNWQTFSPAAVLHMNTLLSFRMLYNEQEDSDFNVYLKYDKYLRPPGYKNLTIYSFYWGLVKMMYRGYAQRFPNKGLTREELAEFLKDIAGAAADLGSVNALGDPESDNFGRTEFMAANLITYATNGFYKDEWVIENQKKIELVSLKESMEYLSLTQLVFNSLNSLYAKMQELCSKDSITRSCFYSNILRAVQESITGMPHLINALSQMSHDEESAYTDMTFKVSVISDEDIQTLQIIRPVHLRNLIFALIYQEVMFSRFNFNSNELLEDNEISHGFPLYQGLIQYVAENVLCLDISSMAEKGTDQAVYNYVVLERKVPPFNDIHGLEKLGLNTYLFYLHWTSNPMLKFQLNRTQLLELAFNLVQALTKKQDQFGACGGG